MASVRREVLDVAGECCLQLGRTQHLAPVLERAWRSSTHFALIRRTDAGRWCGCRRAHAGVEAPSA